MTNHTTWVVVANSAQAKIFRVNKFPKLEEIANIDHPESRMRVHELVSAPPGRNFQKGGVTRHAYEPPHDPKFVENDRFARFLGDHINQAHQKGDFVRLYIMAAPSFLGMLRPHLHSTIQSSIAAELAKDLTDQRLEEIEKHLSDLTP